MSMSAAMGFFSQGLKNECETAVVNEPSVFEPMKFCCNLHEAYENRRLKGYQVLIGRKTYVAPEEP